MATSSVLRSVTIKNSKQCRLLVSALERAQKAKAQTVTLSKPVHDMTPDQMRRVFSQSPSPEPSIPDSTLGE